MLDMLGQRQQQLLRSLRDHPGGMTVDQLTRELGITHNAVRQHLVALERDALITRGPARPTGRRPEQVYELGERGREAFPRQYNWLGGLLVESLCETEGKAALAARLRDLGTRIGSTLRADAGRSSPSHDPADAVDALAEAMRTLGYASSVEPATAGAAPEITARNCVFHHLAERHPEICQFDLALMAAATGREVEHVECMVRGGRCCRFAFNRED
jgi:predicted ArsR family transcriptional regulator